MAAIDLGGRVVVMTGAGSGLGRAMTIALAGAGAKVAAAEINDQHAAELMAEAEAAGLTDNILYIQTDATDPDSCMAMAKQAEDELGPIYGLVNCAGRDYPYDNPGVDEKPPVYKLDPDKWRAVVDLNLNGPFYMVRACASRMAEHGEGQIINVTTSYGTMQRPYMCPYGLTKAALETATQMWSVELAGDGIGVNVLVPGGAANTRLIGDPDGVGMRGEGFDLIEPPVMKDPIVWLMSDSAKGKTSRRYIGKWWDSSIDPDAAAEKAGAPAGWAVPEGQGGREHLPE